MSGHLSLLLVPLLDLTSPNALAQLGSSYFESSSLKVLVPCPLLSAWPHPPHCCHLVVTPLSPVPGAVPWGSFKKCLLWLEHVTFALTC